MSTIDDITQERQRLTDRLAKIDADREKLAAQLSELEAAERVLSRFGQTRPAGRRGRRQAAAGTTDAAVEPRRSRRVAAKSKASSATPPRRGSRRDRAASKAARPALGEATLRAVAARGNGISAEDVSKYLAGEFGLHVRPNHLGMALQRHRRAGRLDQRDSLWFIQHPAADAA